MNSRIFTVLLLLVALLATRLFDVHVHLPPKVSGETPHLVALSLIKAHHHADEVDHGHIAAHLYEGEADKDDNTGLLAKTSVNVMFLLPLLVGLLLLSWRLAMALPGRVRRDDPPRRTRHRAHLAPPSQAPPLPA